MTSVQLAARAYSNHGENTRSMKDLEYDVILRVTRELASSSEVRSKAFPAFAKALSQNERLWIEIATQVASPDNLLPQQLRAGLFFMSEFVARHTALVLKGEADPQSLIEMNVAVLRGLKAKG